MDSKDELRKYAKELRLNIKDKEKKESIITKKILEHEKIKNCENILIYISIKDEVSTIIMIKELLKLHKNIYAPKIVDKNIKFYRINSLDSLKKSKLNILEPLGGKEFINDYNSVCIVPGLLFDKHNNRLGYGGGYYDKFLSKHKIYKIGICFKDFLIDNLKTERYDIKMDEVITEGEVYGI